MEGRTPAQNPAWIELIQLVPVVSFALPFVWSGSVDLARARPGFTVGALLFVVACAVVVSLKHLSNPILVGTGSWLCLGALAFNLGIAELGTWLASVRGFALFLAAAVVGLVTTFGSAHGYIGARSSDRAWVRRASLFLLSGTALALAWSWFFRSDVRVGGGIPFIALNVTRRILIRRAP